MSEQQDRSGPWLLAGITLFWGLNFVTIKYSVAEVPIWTFRTICLLTGGFGLLGIAKAVGFSLRVPRAEWRPLVIAAIGNITGWHIFSAWGLQYVPASSHGPLRSSPALTIPTALSVREAGRGSCCARPAWR